MSRDTVIESWLASMSKSELIDQCFLWHDMALVHGRMYNVVKNKNAKLQELVANYSAAAKYLCGFSHCDECNLDCASVFGDAPNGWDCARMLLDKRARELEMEVNE